MAHNGSRIQPRFLRVAYIAAFFSVFGCVWLLSHWRGNSPSPWGLYKRHYLNRGWTTEDEVWEIHSKPSNAILTFVLAYNRCSLRLQLRALACVTSVFPRRTLGSLDLTDGLVPSAFGMTTRKDVYQWKQQLRGIDVATPLMIYSKVLEYSVYPHQLNSYPPFQIGIC